jgi:hypothetical protein
MISLLPYIDQAPLYNKIEGGDPTTTPFAVPPGGAAPWSGWIGWTSIGQLPALRCPSDPGFATTRGLCNYAFSRGDFLGTASGSGRDAQQVNGLFALRTTYGVRDCVDGASNTMAFSERVAASFGTGGAPGRDVREGTVMNVTAITTSPGACLAAAAPLLNGKRYTTGANIKGKFSSIWMDGQPENVAFYSVLPPNGPSCTNDTNNNADAAVAVLSASSYHAGGVHVLLADGAVRFVSDSIDTGNLGVTTALNARSPYGVWGALGTKRGGDLVGEF